MNPEEFKPLGWSWVRVPRSVLAAPLSGTDALVWVVLAKHRDRRTGVVANLPRDVLMTELGRLGRRGDVVTVATNRLSRTCADDADDATPLLVKRHDYRAGGKTRATYTLPVHNASGFEPLEYPALDLLQRNEVAPEDLLWLLRWRDACGSERQTDKTHHEMAQHYGAGLNTVKRHYRTLVGLGLLCSHVRPGQSNLTTAPTVRALQRIYDHLGGGPWSDAGEDWPT